MSTATNKLAQKIELIEFHSGGDNSSAQHDPSISPSPKGQINAGALLAFDKNTRAQDKQDVQNSILFAQLAANAAYDRFEHTSDWQKKFYEVLSLIGWSQISFEDSSEAIQAPVDWNTQVLNLLSTSAPSTSVETMKNTLSSAEKLAMDSKAIQIWKKQSCGPKNTLLMNGVSSITTNDDLTLNILTINFETSRQLHKYQSWETFADSHSSITQAVLNSDIYKVIRKQIEKKLSGRIHQYVANL